MDSDSKRPPGTQPERERTDESLRTERENTDRAMAEQRAGVEDEADALVDSARERADATLRAARRRVDRGLETATPGTEASGILHEERALEDRALEGERTAADARIERERDDLTRTLAALLPLEREKTDLYLLTERARSDDALAQRDDFLGMVSHDLRSLLGGIVIDAELLAGGASTSEEGRRAHVAAARIQRHAARMNRLIADLVDVVSIEAGRLAVLPAAGDAAALVEEAVSVFSHTASERGIGLECHSAEAVLPAEFDHVRMLQVLANFIANALKFTPRGGRVVVAAERSGDRVRLSVSDTGIGIPSDVLPRVFERFWQADAEDRRGMGLGLYISKSLVEAHGGRIWAESEPGRGSAFHATIPAAPSGGA